MNSEKQKTILLIVEDEAIIALSEKSKLELYGYKVITTSSGEKAIELVNNCDSIDLILMDIDLGKGIDGTIAAAIILKTCDIPIVFLSSHTEREIVEKTEKITSYGYVVKNSSPTVLDAAIKMALKLYNVKVQLKKELLEHKIAKDALTVSESRYRSLFESTKDGILLVDAESGETIYSNPFLVEMLGLSKESFIKKTIWEIDCLNKIIKNQDDFIELRNNEYIRYDDLPLKTASGKIIEVELISNLYIAENKKLIQLNIRNIEDRLIAKRNVSTLLSEKDIILKEVHHRMKNNMNIITSLLSFQAEIINDPIAVNALNDAGARVQSMVLLYDKLAQSSNFLSLSIKEYLTTLVHQCIVNFPNSKSVTIEEDIEDFMIDVKLLQPLGIVINELCTNIMKYAFNNMNNGLITLTVKNNSNTIIIMLKDNGIAIPESTDFEHSTGLGLMLVNELIKQINATIRIERGIGNNIIIEFKI